MNGNWIVTESGGDKLCQDEIMEKNLLDGTWPIHQFKEGLPVAERKAEWIRFKEQFERIVQCKGGASPKMKINALKVFAGNYLLSVIEGHECKEAGDEYRKTVEAIDAYFDGMCDTMRERIKLREMSMRSDEWFSDWVLRLERQAKFCSFDEKQKEGEVVQAILRRSVPAIAAKLYEMAEVLENDIHRIIKLGKRLDATRQDDSQRVWNGSFGSGVGVTQGGEGGVNAVMKSRAKADSRMAPYNSRGDQSTGGCRKCGKKHGFAECAAFMARCYRCDTKGHFARMCNRGGTGKWQKAAGGKRQTPVNRVEINEAVMKESGNV
uniref:CCHC-type domain-containing protein n=1 Tax=Anopheles atroparvus TaxID=41427 RepID=A0AAG5DN06_ANOAO